MRKVRFPWKKYEVNLPGEREWHVGGLSLYAEKHGQLRLRDRLKHDPNPTLEDVEGEQTDKKL